MDFNVEIKGEELMASSSVVGKQIKLYRKKEGAVVDWRTAVALKKILCEQP